ncbi:MAG TPA: BamA/TamA family outer membrane protein [Kofleriaceae bacterium]|nr:BamA/TamA family outer membrane protein [Kofleriaceae bacterium]
MRRVALALLITASTAARAQTPYPVPVPPEELPPSPPPAPPPDPRPTPVPLGPDNKPIEQQPQQPAPQQPQQPPQQQPTQQQPQPQQPQPQPPQPQPPQPQPPQQPQPQPTPPPPDLKIEQKLEPNETLPTAADLTASLTIKKIVVEDNTKTTSDTVEVLAGIETGDSWNASMVDVVKTRLVSSGLFKDVEVYWTRIPEGVVVHILAKDKHSWVIAPAFYNQPTNVGGGIGFGENNLFGQNQKLLLYGQIATGDSFFIGAWVIPSIGGTRFYSQLDTYLKSGRNIEYTAPDSWLVEKDEIRPIRESRIHYLNFGVKLGIELWRGVKVDTRLRAASVSYQDVHLSDGATMADIKPGPDPMVVPAPGMEGTDVSNEWSFTIDRRANWYGVQEGRKYTVSYEHATPSLGSDFRYWLASFSAFRAYKVLDRHNLILKGAVNYGHNLPFQQEFQTGGTSMRGWLNNEFRGDFRTLANLEYSVPMFTIHGFSVRGLAFWDSAYTTFINTTDNETDGVRNYLPNSEVRGLDGFKNSVGVGTRFYLRQIVLPLLGLDFGYGLEARDVQIYLAIGLTD